VKYVFKIWSKYDGFTPAQLPARRKRGGYLDLHWARYIETVEPDSEVWVYFFGPQSFENGVYVKGVAHKVDVAARKVVLRIREASVDAPLTDAATSAHIARTVAARGLQVFVLPEFLDVAPACDIATTTRSCAARRCGSCATWQDLPRLSAATLGWPENLSHGFTDYVAAYWVIPPRNFIHQSGRRIKTRYKLGSELFYRFKMGEKGLAFPMALSIRENLAERGLDDDFEVVVPVPLSPDKEARNELHRTRLLATELARLIGARRRDLLSLSKPTSKHVLQGQRGYSPAQFEATYVDRLVVSPDATRFRNVLLVDDVCTKGNTLSACLAGLLDINPQLNVVAVTAGQMTVKAAVERPSDLVA
jgi:predicted amidophosphoribosyltransferase